MRKRTKIIDIIEYTLKQKWKFYINGVLTALYIVIKYIQMYDVHI